MKITVDLNVVREFITVNGAMKLVTKDVKPLAATSYSLNQRNKYFSKNSNLPPIHDFTAETIENSGINYVSGVVNGVMLYTCYHQLSFKEVLCLLQYYNHHNRKINWIAVERYAGQMLDQDWRPGAKSIIIGDDKEEYAILDGQHRLLAYLVLCYCVMSAYPDIEFEDLPKLDIQINFNTPPSSQAKMDEGSKRTYNNQHDLLVRRGETAADSIEEHKLASLIAEQDKVSAYNIKGSKTASETDKQNQIKKYKKALVQVTENNQKYKDSFTSFNRKRSFSSIDAVFTRIAHRNLSLADAIQTAYLTGNSGTGFTKDKNPAIALREFALKHYELFKGASGHKLATGLASLAAHNYKNNIPTRSLSVDDVRDALTNKVTFSVNWDDFS